MRRGVEIGVGRERGERVIANKEKLQDYDHKTIANLFKTYRTQRSVARELGVAQSTLNNYLHKPGNEHLRYACEFGEEYLLAPTPQVVGADSTIDTDVSAIRQVAEQRFNVKNQRARQKKNQYIRFPHGPAVIVFVGDQHIGNAGSDVGRMFDEQSVMKDIPGAYVWQLGDIVDNFIIGKLMAENMKPSLPVWEQWELARYYLHGFEDRLVAYTGGNHEAWSMMLTGIDYRRDICPEGVLYDGDEVRATVTVGEYEYRVWARHRWRGASMYNPTHQLERAARFDSGQYDLYVGAHLHTGSVYREFTLDGERKAAIQTGSYKIWDDYARASGFPRTDSSTACAVVLHDDGSYFGCADLEVVRKYMQACYQPSSQGE